MSRKNIVLMLGHRSLAGKDTSAGYLNKFGWKRLAFADKLKSTVADLYDFSHEQMHGSLKDVEDKRYPNMIDAEYTYKYVVDEEDVPQEWEPSIKVLNPIYKPHLTPRRVLQIFGQDQRKLYPDIWAQYVFNQIDRESSLVDGLGLYVITDFRFANEFAVAKRWENAGAKRLVLPVKIVRDVEAKSGATDQSEHDLDNFDNWYTVIFNDGTLDELKDNAGLLHSMLEGLWN